MTEWLNVPDWLFPLPIFPEGSLASSVITTVWVGVFVIAFFNLRFGWVLSGLVVPGYLVPLLIARPFSFCVIFVEASVTYFLVWLFSERFSGGRSWSSLFGRDRFVALVLVSIVVRLTFDGWILPILAAWLDRNVGLAIAWSANLHSFGLIVIALLANQLWKTGFAKGMFQALVTIGLTWLIIRYGLMELTNFRISAVAYLYEDLASSILASPKAYIILITTAILASRMNLRYGWDFNGVLIPALIALQWYQPLKVLTSFVEAFAIYGIAAMLLRLPIFANLTIEGARKILLFFNISFACRMLIGHALFWAEVDVKITDYYGFGYLLSTLMAIKMFDKDILARLSRATLQISMVGVAAGSAIAFALTLLLVPAQTAPVPEGRAPLIENSTESVARFLGEAAVAAYRSWRPDAAKTLTPGEFQLFREGARIILSAPDDDEALREGLRLLSKAGYALERIAGGMLSLVDRQAGRNGGAFLIDPSAETGLIISLPDPLAVPGLALAIEPVMKATGARAIALSGQSMMVDQSRIDDPRQDYETFFQAFHEASEGGILQIDVEPDASGPARLRIPNRLPSDLDTGRLEAALGSLDAAFGRESRRGSQEAVAAAGFAELWLNRRLVRQLLAEGGAFQNVEGTRGLRSFLLDDVLADGSSPAPPAADLADFLYLDREVLSPLFNEVLPNWRSEEAELALTAADQAAQIFGYRLIVFRDGPEGDDHLLLAGMQADRGAYLFRAAAKEDIAVQVPRPDFEINTLEFGLAFYERAHAAAMFLPPISNGRVAANEAVDRSALDPLDPLREPNMFDLVSEVFLREHEGAMMVAQIRGFALPVDQPTLTFDAVITFDLIPARDALRPLEAALVAEVQELGAEVTVADGGPETAGFEFGWVRQARYLEATAEKRFAIVWLSPDYRAGFADQGKTAAAETASLAALGIASRETSLQAVLEESTLLPAGELPERLIEAVGAYQRRGDAVALYQAQAAFPELTLFRVFDPESRQSFLAIADEKGRTGAVANLSPLDPDAIVKIGPGTDAAGLERFVRTRAGWLLVEGGSR